MCLERCQSGEQKTREERTSNNENIIRDPNVVEDPWSFDTLQKYPV